MFAKDFKKQARDCLNGKWGTAILVYVIHMVIAMGCSAIPVVGSFAALIIGGPLVLGLTFVFIQFVRGGTPEVGDMFWGFKANFLESFLLQLINSVFIFLWSLLFIIPGIVKAYSYAMSFYILADNPGISQSEARKASVAMMQGNRWRLFCLELSFIGWMILGMFTFGILYIWLVPYMQAAYAAFYEDLKAKNAPAVEQAPSTDEPATCNPEIA
ncbi:MAG: DUF975 family protein [Oscillospiraceae bacterium]|nr:DUF975 family protein [Oscillospiraceae bacterium]